MRRKSADRRLFPRRGNTLFYLGSGWWWRQSGANSSPTVLSLIYGKIQGMLRIMASRSSLLQRNPAPFQQCRGGFPFQGTGKECWRNRELVTTNRDVGKPSRAKSHWSARSLPATRWQCAPVRRRLPRTAVSHRCEPGGLSLSSSDRRAAVIDREAAHLVFRELARDDPHPLIEVVGPFARREQQHLLLEIGH